MAASPSRNDWLGYNIALDAFKLSGISIDFFLQDIIQISGEFEAKHAVDSLHEIEEIRNLLFNLNKIRKGNELNALLQCYLV